MAKYLHKSSEVSKTMSNSFVKEDSHFVHVLKYMWNSSSTFDLWLCRSWSWHFSLSRYYLWTINVWITNCHSWRNNQCFINHLLTINYEVFQWCNERVLHCCCLKLDSFIWLKQLSVLSLKASSLYMIEQSVCLKKICPTLSLQFMF